MLTIAAAHTPPVAELILPQGLLCEQERQKAWRILEDAPLPAGRFTIDLAEVVHPPERATMDGDKVLESAGTADERAGQRHAEHILSYKEIIPTEWRAYYIVFPGTIWVNQHGEKLFVILELKDDEWGMRPHHYNGWFDRDARTAQLRQTN